MYIKQRMRLDATPTPIPTPPATPTFNPIFPPSPSPCLYCSHAPAQTHFSMLDCAYIPTPQPHASHANTTNPPILLPLPVCCHGTLTNLPHSRQINLLTSNTRPSPPSPGLSPLLLPLPVCITTSRFKEMPRRAISLLCNTPPGLSPLSLPLPVCVTTSVTVCAHCSTRALPHRGTRWACRGCRVAEVTATT